MQETVLITGGAGLVGAHLTHLLLTKKYKVMHMARTSKRGSIPCFKWDLPAMQWDEDVIDGVDYIIHLAGANVAEGRWTSQRKKEILDSRIRGSQLVSEMVAASNGRIKGVVSASAVGYYGTDSSEFSRAETDESGTDFLANVCVQWEEEIAKSETNVAILRTGVVLSAKGGAVPKMLAPIKWGVGSALGLGSQVMPWIHINDLCEMYAFMLEQNMEGVYNAVAPEIVSNRDLTQALAKAVGRRIILPNIPSFMLKMMLGEMSTMLLTGVVASPQKIIDAGFKFEFKNLDKALKNLLLPVY